MVWEDPTEEALAVQSQRARLARIQSYRQNAATQRARAQAVQQIAAAYPHLSAGEVMPLALSGATVDSPVTQQVAVAAAKKNKKKRGGVMGLLDRGKAAFGDVVGFGGDIARTAGDIGSNILKPVARYGTAILSAPVEEAIGAGRALAANIGEIGAGAVSGATAGAGVGAFFGGIGAIPGAIGGAIAGGVAGGVAEMRGVDVEGSGWRPQSALLTSITGGPGLGEGYLPGKAVYEEAGRRARQTGRIGNHAWTPGRFFAATAFDEDTAAYNLLSGAVDLTTAIKLDPAAVGGAKLGKARRQVRNFERPSLLARNPERAAVGLVDGSHRPGIVRENARAWLDSGQGARLKQAVANEDDFEKLRRMLPDVEYETILDLKDAKTADEVAAVLGPKIGIEAGLESKPAISGIVGSANVKVRRTLGGDTVRMFQNMPRAGINLSRPDEAIEQFSRLQHNARLGYDVISRNNEAFARAIREGDMGRARAILVKDFVGGDQGVLAKHGIHGDMRRQMERVWNETDDALRADVLDDVASGGGPVVARLGGDTQQLPIPGLMAEALENVLDFDQDTIRQIRRLTGRYPGLMTSKPVDWTVDAADFLTGKVWKLTALIRGAYTVRNIGEAQARMAAVGHDSVFSHPMDFLAWAASDEKLPGRILKKMGVKAGRGQVDPMGMAYRENPIEFERAVRGEMNHYAEALNREARRDGWLDGTLARGRYQQNWARGEDGFNAALAEKLELLHRDPLIRALADPRRAAARTETRFPWAPEMVFQDPELGPVLRDFARQAGVRQLSTAGGRLPEVDVMREYLTRSLKQAQSVAGNDPRLWNALYAGEIDGVAMRGANGALSKEFGQAVARVVESGAGPAQVVGSSLAAPGLADKWNRAVRGAFDIIETKPTAAMVSSPTFRQFQWDETRRLITEATPEAQRALIEAAGEAGMSKRFMDELRAKAKMSSGDLSHEEVTALSGHRGMRQTRQLLYQATDKSQLVDILRIVFPFAQAQMNSLRTWARLGMENPQVGRRFSQAITGARGAGIFYKDPQTGEEMFSYPGSELVTGSLFGQPIPMGGPVKGLNMFGSGLMPGFGPTVQVSARWLIPDTPKFDNLREIIDPFGESAEGSTFDQMMEQFVPGFLRKAATGWSADMDDRRFGDTVFNVFAAGVSSGEYDNTTEEGIKAGMESAKAKARVLFVIQGLATLTGAAPSNPTPEFVAKDRTGQWHMIGALKEEYQKLITEDPKNASERFLEKFGTNVGMLIQPTTYTGGKVLSDASTAAGEWVRNHEGVVADYDAVYGAFAPSVDSDDFDSQTWARQLRTGERWPLDPEQRIRLGNDRLAKTIYYNAKDRFGPYPSKPQRQVLSALREALRNEYPGFEENLALPEKVKTEDKVAQLERAVDDERLADNPVIPSLRTYLLARSELNKQAVAAGFASVNQAKAAAPLRALLRQLGEALVQENPAFSTAWDRILRAEIAIDEVDTEAGSVVA